ncbi:zinc-binding dehydrogenase-domain-containing protein [Xylariomycetidae sp. FL0641]|nr:zinc-binding dehydrogenase-domain-containing protein [Xylariomycetidae sp. FL0641]
MAAEVAAQRQEFAREFGATHILDPSQTNVVERCREITGSRGPRIAFDCAGVAASLDTATRAVRARGTVVNVAVWGEPVPFFPNNILFHEKRYIGSLTYQLSDFDRVIDALCEKKLKPERMITKKIAIERVVEDGFEPLMHEKDKHVKIMVDLTAGSGIVVSR